MYNPAYNSDVYLMVANIKNLVVLASAMLYSKGLEIMYYNKSIEKALFGMQLPYNHVLNDPWV